MLMPASSMHGMPADRSQPAQDSHHIDMTLLVQDHNTASVLPPGTPALRLRTTPDALPNALQAQDLSSSKDHPSPAASEMQPAAQPPAPPSCDPAPLSTPESAPAPMHVSAAHDGAAAVCEPAREAAWERNDAAAEQVCIVAMLLCKRMCTCHA